jgi:ribosome-binding factor A
MADNKIADRRRNRIESQIINILNHTIKYEAYDQELKMISFTYVKLTDDKTLAKVYVDTYNRKNIDRFVKKLNDSASLFKRALASELQI